MDCDNYERLLLRNGKSPKMAECNKNRSSVSIENSDHKTDSVVNKTEKSSFLYYSEGNFAWKSDLKSLKAFAATILTCDDAKWSCITSRGRKAVQNRRVQLKMARPEEKKAADHER